MLRNDRLARIVDYFLCHDLRATGADLQKRFGISERTLRSDMGKINADLTPLEAEIRTERGKGYHLIADEAALAELRRQITSAVESKNLDTSEKRVNNLTLTLLYADDYISQDELAQSVYISSNTLAGYIRQIRQLLESHQLELTTKSNYGYLIQGSELNRRSCIFNLLVADEPYDLNPMTFSETERLFVGASVLESTTEAIKRFSFQRGIRFTDYNLHSLLVSVAIAVSRMKLGSYVETTDAPAQKRPNGVDALFTILEEEFPGLTIPPSEQEHIIEQLLKRSSSFFSIDDDEEYARALTTKILDYAKEGYNLDLRDDTETFDGLTRHLQSVISAKRNGVTFENPLLNTIRTNYVLAWEIANTAVKTSLGDEPFLFEDDDIAYIALYIAMGIERKQAKSNVGAKRAIVVFDNGNVEGSFIAAQLETNFSGKLIITGISPANEVSRRDPSTYDFAISTIDLPTLTCPLIKISFPLSKGDLAAIDHFLDAGELSRIDRISGYFDDSLFMRLDVEDKDEAIHVLCAKAQEQGITKEGFEESVFEREERISTAMSETVALPHPLKILCTESKVAVGILEHPVSWRSVQGNESAETRIRLVFLLCLSDDQPEVTTLFDIFVKLISDSELLDRLLETNSAREFLDVLRERLA